MAAAASIASTGIVLEVVTKDNYLNWSTLVKNYLMGKGLWDNIIEGDINPDHIPDWKSKNRKALHAIQLSCGYQTLRQIRNCETAREAWNHLKNSFSEDLKAYQHDIEQGLQNDLGRLHNAVKKGLWKEANSIISSNKDIIFEKSSSNGWTALHVAVAAGQEEIMKKLVEIGKESLLTETDWQGYTPLALAAESTDDKEMAEWMVSKGGKDLLTMKIKPNDGKGDIPVLLAAAKGHKKMTRYLFAETRWFTLLHDNCYYGDMLLSLCIHAEIFDVAAALLQHKHDDPQLSLSYQSDQCTQPIYGLAHIPSAFRSGSHLNHFQQVFYMILRLPKHIDLGDKRIRIESHDDDGRSNTGGLTGKICRLVKSLADATKHSSPTFGQFQQVIQTSLLVASELLGNKIYEMKKDHYLVREILKSLGKRIERISSNSDLHQWSAHDAMLQAAKYGIIEFIEAMREANPDLLLAKDKSERGIFAHAILNRQERVFKLIREIKSQKGLITSIDVFGNNLLHLAAELGPSSDRARRSNAALQMQRELKWFKAVERIVPPMCKESKNADGLKPNELFTKNHEQLLKDGRQWAKDTSSSFTIVGTLIITIMFAAAFTLPGGNNQNNGIPVFLGKDAFSLFIIADALSLIASSSSVLMFIGILTSRYAEKDFNTSLPIKLLFGLITIFLSVVFMMCAFCAALAMMLKGYRWIVIAAIVLAIIPISVFMLSLLRLFLEICISLVRS